MQLYTSKLTLNYQTMKPLYKASILMLLAIAMLYSCGKSTVKPASANSVINIDGYWYGTYVTATQSSNLGVLFRKDGSFKIYDFAKETSQTDTMLSANGTGQYTVSHDTLNFAINVPAGYSYNGSGTGIINTTTSETIKINIDGGDVTFTLQTKNP
jgi:hypothetical protein